MSEIAVVVLAAGKGARFGSIKQLADIGGISMLEHVARKIATLAQDIYLCLGAHAELIQRELCLSQSAPKFVSEVLLIDDWEKGPGAAIKQATRRIANRSKGRGYKGVLFLLGDQPLIPSEHFESILRLAQERDYDSVVCTSYDAIASGCVKTKGVPAFFPSHLFENLLSLPDAQGAKSLIDKENSVSISLPAESLLDVDYQEDLDIARAALSD